jgi:hypothetical protein
MRLNKLGRMRWTGHVAHMGEMRNAYKMLTGKSDGKKASGRARHRWNDNIKTSLKETGCEGVNPLSR